MSRYRLPRKKKEEMKRRTKSGVTTREASASFRALASLSMGGLYNKRVAVLFL
jgi:hypothetical protein